MNVNDTASDKPSAAPAPPPAEASTLSRLLPFLAVLGGIALILYRGLNVLDIGKVAIGLGLVIFIHELGHFLAAKLCKVRVETFSIGFGEPIPGCRFKYGETNYKIGWIPLGGYVKMLGEGENVDSEEAEEDPRSFKNKPVGQRMIIISAGVIMNLFLAGICFLVAYSHGVEERSPVIGYVESGSPAWRAGIQSDMRILQIGNIKSPMFDDIKPIIMSTHKGEQVPLSMETPDGKVHEIGLEPVLNSESLYPVIGVAPNSSLALRRQGKFSPKPYREGSAAASAQPAFQSGDIVTAMKDRSGAWIDLNATAEEKSNYRNKFGVFHQAVRANRDGELKVKVSRKEGEAEIAIPPEYTRSLGMRMQMGRIAAVRKDSPADLAKPLQPVAAEAGLKELTPSVADSGDRIVEVRLPEGDGTYTVITGNHELKPGAKLHVDLLDPVRLPDDLEAWAARNPKAESLQVLVLRTVGHDPVALTYELKWDRAAENHRELVLSPKTPLGIPALGLCYFVEPIVDSVVPGSPADKAGIKEGDVVKEFMGKYLDPKGTVKKQDKWSPVAANQWAFFFEMIQNLTVPDFELKIQRGTGEPMEVTIAPTEDKTWPRVDRGLEFEPDLVLNKADGVVEAAQKGAHRTLRMIRVIYQNLYAMVFGRISAMTMSGPLTIATVSYNIAEENIWQFILFIGLINVNLAVVNFLPIPVLDGGHMVFLLYEKIRGKPANEKVLELTLYAGLFLILMLMLFVIVLDVRRLFF